MSEDLEDFCCKDMMAAKTFDGPLRKDRLGWYMTLYQLTVRRKQISNAIGAKINKPIYFCPWCGSEL